MTPGARFERLDRDKVGDDAHRRAALGTRALPETLTSHKGAAPNYQPDDALVDAVNVALAVGAPLLLTGEPGTGKTQLAHYLAWYFHLKPDVSFFPVYVRSTTTAEDLLYRFDAVAYLHAAQDRSRKGQTLDLTEFREQGALWRAYLVNGPSLVLLDEIDKAPRDFPNDLLNVLDKHEFDVRETREKVRCQGAPPVVVITSNSERRLPEPFLRRCIVHHIAFTEELLRRAVAARQEDFGALPQDVREAAIGRFLELRGRELRKKPATAELLVWLMVLSTKPGITAQQLQRAKLAELPALSALIKDNDDRALLG
jgi:MoxR-like ATPase